MSYLFPLCQVATASEFRFSPRPNRAHLIKWRDWVPETFEEAKATNKLIVLSLSAVWCHWCHVMDETTYSDMKVIDFINEKFMPVRVDSDMRPDIDSIYNQGGWPSTVVLTPEGEILQEGTYLSPQQMLQLLSRALRTQGRNQEGAGKEIQPSVEKVREGKGVDDIVPVSQLL
jgi:hypothetical protein